MKDIIKRHQEIHSYWKQLKSIFIGRIYQPADGYATMIHLNINTAGTTLTNMV